MLVNILSEYLIWFFLFTPIYFLRRGKIFPALYLAGCLLLSWLTGLVIKEFFYFPRPVPFKLLDGTFPSSHTAISFAAATGVVISHGKNSCWTFILAALVGLGRIWSGAHFLLDVIGGALLGIVIAVLLKTLVFPRSVDANRQPAGS